MPPRRPPGARPKIGDVAARARVSPGTVSNVLTGRRRVDPALAERVRAAVEALGYVPHAAASQLRSNRTTVIGVVVPDLPNTFCATFVGKVEELARAEGYRTLVAGSGEDADEELAQVQALSAWRPAGVLIIPTDDRFRAREILASAGVPVVAVDRVTDQMAVDSVGIDNAAEAGRAAAHLLALGHRRVLVIASTLGLSNIRDRVAGVRVALAGRAAVEVVEGGPHVPAIAEAVGRRLERRPVPTAMLALTNKATLGAVVALERAGLSVPRDVSLIGFDDNEWMKAMHPAISAVRQPVEGLARRAWEQLKARLRGDRARPASARLGCSLELRDSTARPEGAGRPGAARPARRRRAGPRSPLPASPRRA
ncbi:MAG TPA: LacI family DNA-binding transcriptional regulator [Anaeromyxobacter sp.]|nr:LacI family DNA-binding transcriptional regulator [Anaeromyxobacter sp.]